MIIEHVLSMSDHVIIDHVISMSDHVIIELLVSKACESFLDRDRTMSLGDRVVLFPDEFIDIISCQYNIFVIFSTTTTAVTYLGL